MLRTVYFELLNVLYAQGGAVPADPTALADLLLLPAEEIARCLPVLKGLGSIEVGLDQITQPRVTKEIARFKELSGKRRKAAEVRWGADVEAAPKKGRPTWLTPYGDEWIARLGGDPPWDRIAKEFKGPHDAYGGEALLAGWRRYLAETEGRFVSASAFAKKLGLWVKKAPAKAKVAPKLPTPDAKVCARWAQARERIEMPAHLKRTWLSPIGAQSLGDNGTLTLIAPSKEHAEAVFRYEKKILAAYNDAEYHDDAPALRTFTIVVAPDATVHEGGL